MQLKDFLAEAYKDERDLKTSLTYSYRHLSYIDSGNSSLQTEEIHRLGDERKSILTGEETLETGFYTLYTGAHDGIELLQKFNSFEEALENKEEWDRCKFSLCDKCFIKEIE